MLLLWYAVWVRSSKERNKLLRMLGPRYARHAWAFQQGKCIYCGEPKAEIDHVPAISWLYALGTSYFESRGFPIILVPSCKRCNSWLGNKPYHSIRQRKGFVAAKLREMFDKLRASPKWTDDEIAEMGSYFQETLRDRESFRAYARRRIEWAESDFPWDLVS